MWVIFSKYIMVGAANTLLTMLVIFALMHSGVNMYVSNALGYVVGIVFSFILNSLFTFSAKLSFEKLIKFLIVCLISYLINLIAIKAFLLLFPNRIYLAQYNMHLEVYIAQLCGMGFYTVTGFVLNKLWVMK
ncbi:polysaccharide synthesis protein GtrA [Commensalibacter intestini]|uniref:Polysaccharide synthesis protein GtrA n=2 Tax=Commensalibacter intestini TaxID=479936 RepID=A0A251ZW69_9PROT|nr:polysaccharide synthesis protein GtrA [Commensalibacter intestini]